MPASIFNERFFSHREPAWHGLGLVLDEELSACQAMGRIGVYAVDVQELRTPGGLVVPQRAVVRHPTPDDPEYRVLGVVGPEYELLDPMTFGRIWDEYAARTVETVGFLGKGEAAFVTTKLPEFDVVGDEVENYLLAANYMDGSRAIELRVTPVRVVCQNTLYAALGHFKHQYSVVHISGAQQRMGEWLADMVHLAETTSATLKDAYTALAEHYVSQMEISFVLDTAYPVPQRPRENAPSEVMALRTQNWEAWCRQVSVRRDGARELFTGRGTGMQTRAAEGTAWGLYNAVAETEGYRRSLGDRSRSMNVLFGNRAQTIAAAFDACVAVAHGEEV